jgi:hypothetical protein
VIPTYCSTIQRARETRFRAQHWQPDTTLSLTFGKKANSLVALEPCGELRRSGLKQEQTPPLLADFHRRALMAAMALLATPTQEMARLRLHGLLRRHR